MMTLRGLLQEKKPAILQRWLDGILTSYAPETGAFLGRGKDRFANPVGHVLSGGIKGVLDSLLDGMDSVGICKHLDEIIRIRAIQDFPPSQAVSFVFLLKQAVRAELGKEAGPGRLAAELETFDARVDQIALFAFDIFVKYRERVYELRVNEVKRSVSAITEMFNRRGPEPGPGGNGSVTDSKCSNA
ncbi:MAG: RsbRD N-terminal domain-containing protein [Planctomycetota bacterium]|jgi:hypothetical protein